MIHVLFYMPVRDERAEAGLKMMEKASLAARTEIFSSIEDLSTWLRRLLSGVTIAVLYAPRAGDFQILLSIKELLQDVYVLLVLPDRKASTLSRGHMLNPRFLTFVDADPSDVGLVLTKMIETYGNMSGTGP